MPVCEHRRSTRHDGARPGVCSEAHLDSNSSSRRGAVGTGVWTARSPILTLQKGKIIPFLPYRRLHGSSWTQGSHRKDVQVVSFSLARSFRTSPRKSGDVKRSVSSSGLGLPCWLSSKEFTCQCRRWVQSLGQEDPLENAPVFLPGKSREQRSLVGYSPWGCKRAGQDLATKQQ